MSAFEQIKARLADRVVSCSDTRAVARCPAHEDRRPSLGLGVRTTGDPGAVVHCQAGCEPEQVMAALDLPIAATFDRYWQPRHEGNGSGLGREIAHYDYQNAEGRLLFQVARFRPKDFRQRRPNIDGTWTWNLNGVERVPYRLPQVIEAAKAHRRVFVAEGERDVHALEAAGETATCNPGGAGKWRADYDRWLAGAEVIVVADRDQPGRKHAEAVRASLEGVAASVRMVEPIEGKDAADHLDAGRSPDEFVEVNAATSSGPAGDDGSSAGRTLAVETFAQIQIERPRWLWEGRIPLGTATLLVGREKLGKSTLTVELAARLSRGELEGDLAGSVARTLIVSYEDSAASTIKPRLLAAGADLEQVARVQAIRDGVGDLVSLPADVEALAQAARESKAKLIVIDPLSASLGGDIDGHRDQDIRRALAPLVRLAEQEDLALVCVAHWNKSAGGDPLSRVLGSRGLTAAVRSVLAFGRTPEAEDGPDRVLAHAASNLGREAPSLACRIEGREVYAIDGEVISTSRLVIVGETDARADELLVTRSHEDRGQSEDAVEWLADELADGDWHPGRELKAAAKAAGISEKALRTARERLAVEVGRSGFASRGGGQSEWRLPLVPSPSNRAGHERAGHEREKPVDTGDRGDSPSRSCPSSKEGTSGAEEPLFSEPEAGPDEPPDDPPTPPGVGSLTEQFIRERGGQR